MNITLYTLHAVKRDERGLRKRKSSFLLSIICRINDLARLPCMLS